MALPVYCPGIARLPAVARLAKSDGATRLSFEMGSFL